MTSEDLFGSMFSTPELSELFSGRSWVQAMLDVEAALAAAEERAGVLPAGTAAAIRQHCDASRYDIATLAAATAAAANPGGPVAAVLRAACGDPLGSYVHLGATSQDIVDSAMMLLARRALEGIQKDLVAAAEAAATLADCHRATVMASRTLLQQGVPITFGLKAAGWLLSIDDARERLGRAGDDATRAQLGGASGCLASLGVDGPRVAVLFAAELGMSEPVIPWHAARGPVAGLASALGIAIGALGKVALDVALLAQTEVAEAAIDQPAEHGRSSAMAHKHNPVAAVNTIACSRRALALIPGFFSGMLQEHERAAGAWQAEWSALAELLQLTGAAARSAATMLAGLKIDERRMRGNIDPRTAAEAVTAVLAEAAGGPTARAIVGAALESARPFREALVAARALEHVRAEALDAALDPATVVPFAAALVDRALAAHARLSDAMLVKR